MPTPTSAAAEQGLTASVTAVASLSAIFAGADVSGLILGLIAAVLMTFLLGGIDSRTKAIAGVAIAALLAGYGGPFTAEILAAWKPDLKSAIDMAHPLVSIAIGAVSPTLVPIAMAKLKARAEGF